MRAVNLAFLSVGILTGCLFQRNSATGRAVAVNTQDASHVVQDTPFEGGSADEGGFAVVAAAELDVNSTVSRKRNDDGRRAIRFKEEVNFTMHTSRSSTVCF